MDKYYNTYNELADMEIIEMNVDKIEDFHMYLSRNGQMITDKVVFTKEESGSGNKFRDIPINIKLVRKIFRRRAFTESASIPRIKPEMRLIIRWS